MWWKQFKSVKYFFFPLSTHQSPQQNVLVVSHDKDDVALFWLRFRAPDATGEQRCQQHCDGCRGSSPPAWGSSGSGVLDCHWVTSAPPDTHTHTDAHSCSAVLDPGGENAVARCTHTHSLRKWSWSYDQSEGGEGGGGGVTARNTVYKSGLLNFYTIHL